MCKCNCPACQDNFTDHCKWCRGQEDKLPMNDKEKEFVEEIVKLSEKYGLSLSHDDTNGSFLIEPYDKANIHWLRSANYTTYVQKL